MEREGGEGEVGGEGRSMGAWADSSKNRVQKPPELEKCAQNRHLQCGLAALEGFL